MHTFDGNITKPPKWYGSWSLHKNRNFTRYGIFFGIVPFCLFFSPLPSLTQFNFGWIEFWWHFYWFINELIVKMTRDEVDFLRFLASTISAIELIASTCDVEKNDGRFVAWRLWCVSKGNVNCGGEPVRVVCYRWKYRWCRFLRVPFVQILHLIEIFSAIVSHVSDIQIADVNMYDFSLQFHQFIDLIRPISYFKIIQLSILRTHMHIWTFGTHTQKRGGYVMSMWWQFTQT